MAIRRRAVWNASFPFCRSVPHRRGTYRLPRRAAFCVPHAVSRDRRQRLRGRRCSIVRQCRPRGIRCWQGIADQRCPDMARGCARKAELREFVRIRARTGADADRRVDLVRGRNGQNALPAFAQRGIGMVPRAGRDCEHGGKVQHHGPCDGHHIILRAVTGRDQNHRPRFDERECLVEIQLFQHCLHTVHFYADFTLRSAFRVEA